MCVEIVHLFFFLIIFFSFELVGICERNIFVCWLFLQPARIIGTGTFGCGSTIVEGEDFIAENITFENSAPQVMHCLCCKISLFSRFFFVLRSPLSVVDMLIHVNGLSLSYLQIVYVIERIPVI